jgi:hypothetical protein
MKTIYVIANLDPNNLESSWMNTTPFIKIDSDTEFSLQMISDIHWNCLGEKNEIINFTVYKIDINNYKDFYNKRHTLLDSKNFSYENVESIGFVKLSDFAYKVDADNKTQSINGYEVSLSYHKISSHPDKFYLAHPIIYSN